MTGTHDLSRPDGNWNHQFAEANDFSSTMCVKDMSDL
jgi:hypothetical protein